MTLLANQSPASRRCPIGVLAVWVALVGIGCAPNIEHLNRHLDAGQYDQALAQVADDPGMQKELAALILERAVPSADNPGSLIDTLASAGAPGKRALHRLAGQAEAGSAAPHLAAIALWPPRRPNAAALQAYLDSAYADVRAMATRAGYLTLNEADLNRLVMDPDQRVRYWAAKGLVGLRNAKTVPALLRDILRLDPAPIVRQVAARSGKALGKQALFALKAAMTDENLGVRLAALEGLGNLEDSVATAILEEQMTGPMDEMTIVAAAELARQGWASGQERLLLALSDDRPGIRATGLLHLDRARVTNRKEIMARALSDEAPAVVLLAARSLLRDARLRPRVVKHLGRIKDSGISKSAEARDLLAVLGDETSIQEILKLMAHEAAQVREAAAIAVLRAKGP